METKNTVKKERKPNTPRKERKPNTPKTVSKKTGKELENTLEEQIYISLDLGSDSMVAFWENSEQIGGGELINLQDPSLYKNWITDFKVDIEKEYDFFPNNNEVFLSEMERRNASKRLKNFFSFRQLRKRMSENQLPINFANINGLTTDYDAINPFRFFLKKEETNIQNGLILPNAKLLFASNGQDILKKIVEKEEVLSGELQEKENEKIKINSSDVLQHLTCHILYNFVFLSPQLAETYNDTNLRGKIRLSLTVPNIYSNVHTLALKNFIVSTLKLHENQIKIVYESDATAYYLLSDYIDIEKKIEARNTYDKNREICIITIDVGKGTTDLSCVLIKREEREDVADEITEYEVLGRNGSTYAGQKLNYLFAQEINEKLNLLLSQMNETQNLNNEKISIKDVFIKDLKPFMNTSIGAGDSINANQYQVCKLLEEYIEVIKRNITKENDCYQITNEVSSKLLSHAQKIEEGLRKMLKTDFGSEGDAVNRILSEFKEYLEKTEFIGSNIETQENGETLLERIRKNFNLKHLLDGKNSSNDDIKQSFSDRIDEYIRENTNCIEILKEMADEKIEEFSEKKKQATSRQSSSWKFWKTKPNESELENTMAEKETINLKKKSYIDNETFVVISGQGSQFQPLKRAIIEKFISLDIPKENIIQLESNEAKEACSKGSIEVWKRRTKFRSENDLIGIYFLKDKDAFDIRTLDISKNPILEFTPSSAYEMLFYPGSKKNFSEKIGDNTTKQRFLRSENVVSIDYIPYNENNRRKLIFEYKNFQFIYNGKEIKTITYGNINRLLQQNDFSNTWSFYLNPGDK